MVISKYLKEAPKPLEKNPLYLKSNHNNNTITYEELILHFFVTIISIKKIKILLK